MLIPLFFVYIFRLALSQITMARISKVFDEKKNFNI